MSSPSMPPAGKDVYLPESRRQLLQSVQSRSHILLRDQLLALCDDVPMLQTVWGKLTEGFDDTDAEDLMYVDELKSFRAAVKLAVDNFQQEWTGKMTVYPFTRFHTPYLPTFNIQTMPLNRLVWQNDDDYAPNTRGSDTSQAPARISSPAQGDPSDLEASSSLLEHTFPSHRQDETVLSPEPEAPAELKFDPVWSTAPRLPYPTEKSHVGFPYSVIRERCGLPTFGHKNGTRAISRHHQDMLAALRVNLGNGILMINDPPCPRCAERGKAMDWIGHYCIGLTAQPGTTCFNCTIRSGYQCIPNDGGAVKKSEDMDDRSVATRREARPVRQRQDVKDGTGGSKREREHDTKLASGSGKTWRSRDGAKDYAIIIPKSRLVSNQPSKASSPRRGDDDVNEEILSVLRQTLVVTQEMSKDMKELVRVLLRPQDDVEMDELDDDDDGPPLKRQKKQA